MRELQNVDGLHPRDLSQRQRLLVVYVLGLVAVVLSYTALYNFGMRAYESRPQSVFRSFQAVLATLTTTGYGADAPWTTPEMNVFLGLVQVTGVVIGFVTLRVLIIPLFERAPLSLDDRLSKKEGHVVVAEYRRDTDLLLDELEARDVGYVLLESDQTEAKRLSDEGYQAIHGDPENPSDLDRASVEEASLLVADAGDRNASIVLTAMEANEGLRTVSFATSPRRNPAFTELGVDRSVAPHALIGRRLAEKATTPVAVDVAGEGDGTEDGGEDAGSVEVRELLVRRGSPLHGVRVGDSPLADRSDLTVVAGWFDGELRLPPSPDDELSPNTVLIVAGPERAIAGATADLSNLRAPREERNERIVVAGNGEGGRAARDAIPDDVAVTTVDSDPDTHPDVVGDVTEPKTLRQAGVGGASALIVTVDDDATALLAVATARSLSADVEILVRVTDAGKESPAFGAGADYVLSIQRACARLVAAEVGGDPVVDPVSRIRLVRADADSFVGESLSSARRDGGCGWTVVGVVRDGTVEMDERTTVEPDDVVVVAGSDDAVREFEGTAEEG
ncbi:Trk K+ transport system, NAD-binding component [Halogeometricum rufum]|uniref:Trk K+ transport system, NAD-binding component n=1 Tax=Halogeometricum rufum TaxID=553469 RepID=A0A1I6G3I2_9EURY|nr:NAD-binding protein [Halogeometricum rufum]SFR36607.1 Trk K+ transport system, NAD-binding component [Halogeometricum rufum]